MLYDLISQLGCASVSFHVQPRLISFSSVSAPKCWSYGVFDVELFSVSCFLRKCFFCNTGSAGIRYGSTKMRVRGWISAVVFMTPQSRMLILSLMRVALLRLENFIATFTFLVFFFLPFNAGLIIVVMLRNPENHYSLN